jgi:hypothetical protein
LKEEEEYSRKGPDERMGNGPHPLATTAAYYHLSSPSSIFPIDWQITIAATATANSPNNINGNGLDHQNEQQEKINLLEQQQRNDVAEKGKQECFRPFCKVRNSVQCHISISSRSVEETIPFSL